MLTLNYLPAPYERSVASCERPGAAISSKVRTNGAFHRPSVPPKLEEVEPARADVGGAARRSINERNDSSRVLFLVCSRSRTSLRPTALAQTSAPSAEKCWSSMSSLNNGQPRSVVLAAFAAIDQVQVCVDECVGRVQKRQGARFEDVGKTAGETARLSSARASAG